MADKIAKLKEIAEKAYAKAYSPYSNMKIGAAVLASSGKIYDGVNVENASFGATICAERTALVKAVSEGETSIEAIAITGDLDDYAYPCGICRQVLREFMAKDKKIFVSGKNKEWKQYELEDLLPDSFAYFEKNK